MGDRAAEVRAAKLCVGEVRAMEVRATKVRAAEVRSVELCADQARTLEVRVMEVSVAEFRTEAGVAEVRVAEVGVVEPRGVEVRAAEVRAAEIRLPDIELHEIQRRVRPSDLTTPEDGEHCLGVGRAEAKQPGLTLKFCNSVGCWAEQVIAVEGPGPGEQPPELLGTVGPSLDVAETGVRINWWPRGRDLADRVGVDAPIVLGRLEDAVKQRPAGHYRVVTDLAA
jgi:hypothetical protein